MFSKRLIFIFKIPKKNRKYILLKHMFLILTILHAIWLHSAVLNYNDTLPVSQFVEFLFLISKAILV